MTRRTGLVAALVALGLIFLSPSAQAHALLKASVPEDGALLQSPPSQILMTFTEAPDLGLSIVHVLDSSGHAVESGKPQGVPGDAEQMRVAVGHLGTGVFTVSWRVISRADGHLTSGSFSFGVGVSVIPPSTGSGGTVVPTSPAPSALSVAAKWLYYWGLALLLAAAVVSLVAFEGRIPGGGTLLLSSWAAGAVGVVLLVVDERNVASTSLGQLLGSGRGHALVAQLATVGATGIAALVAARWRTSWSRVLLGVGSGAALLAHAFAGHAGAASSWKWFRVGDQWLHLLSVGVWIGGLLLLLLGLRGIAPGYRVRAAKRFSATATVALAAVAITGTIRAIDEVGSWGRFVSTSFGVTLLVKIGLFCGLVTLGALNRFRNVPRLATERASDTPLRGTVSGEVGLAAIILAVTGVLTGLAPASSIAATERPSPANIVVEASDFARSIRAKLTVTPGTVGPNRFELSLRDYDSGAPVAAESVVLRFSLPSRVDVGTSVLAMKQTSRGNWVAQGTSLSIEGRWHVVIAIQQVNNALEIPVDFATRTPPENITCQPAPGQPTICTIRFPDGRSAQAYLDPGKAGLNEIHWTFFDSSGNELPIASLSIEAEPASGPPPAVEIRRLSAGHFVGDATLAAGRWRFRVSATPRTGNPMTAYFDQPVS